MNELIEKHNSDVKDIMERYSKETEQYLQLADEVYEAEYSFRKNIKKMLSPESFQKGLGTYLSEVERIQKILEQKRYDYKRLYDECNTKNLDFAVAISVVVKKNEFMKADVEEKIKPLESEFDNQYSDTVKEYTEKISKKIERSKKEVELNRKFVAEYGGLKFDENDVVNNVYAPIYAKHDEVDDKFLFDFEAIALTLNSVPRIIKEEYSHIIKSLDDNYNPLKDIFGE